MLIDEVRVESRDAIYPTFRVPLQTPVRELSGVVRPRSAGADTVPVVRGPTILIPERSKGPMEAVWE